MSDTTRREAPAPPGDTTRIDSLDLVRGVALLGIFVMNAVAFALPVAAYSNLDAGGNSNPLDTAIGTLGRVFVDQKMMAIFSLLFGVGIVIFAERAAAKGRRPVLLSLWRNALLFVIGIAHTIAWDGDVLTVYAACAPLVLLLRNRPAWTLAISGVALAVSGAVAALLSGPIEGSELGSAWFVDGGELSGHVDAILLLDVFGRALGLMLLGVALYRWGVVQAHRSDDEYRRLAAACGAIGTALSVWGWSIHAASDWSGSDAIVGYAISTLGTVPLAVCYVALLVRWSRRPATRLHGSLQAVGRMALTNYLAQTVVGLVVIGGLLGSTDLSRTAILAIVVAVWATQLIVSPWWLSRFRMGPVEWAWRNATYRQRQPLRR